MVDRIAAVVVLICRRKSLEQIFLVVLQLAQECGAGRRGTSHFTLELVSKRDMQMRWAGWKVKPTQWEIHWEQACHRDDVHCNSLTRT